MDKLKKYFPYSFKEKSDVGALILCILLYVAAAIVFGFVIGLFGNVPILNWLFGLIGAIAELYLAVGVVLVILDYCKVLK